MPMILEAAAGSTSVEQLVTSAGTFTDGFLAIGTKIFNWGLANPLFLLGIFVMIIFTVVGLVMKFSR